jgi:hypothetical protein
METFIKMAFMIGAVFMFFVLPYFIMQGKLFNIIMLDLIALQISMGIGICFALIINEIRKDCGRGVGIFFSTSRYKDY